MLNLASGLGLVLSLMLILFVVAPTSHWLLPLPLLLFMMTPALSSVLVVWSILMLMRSFLLMFSGAVLLTFGSTLEVLPLVGFLLPSLLAMLGGVLLGLWLY